MTLRGCGCHYAYIWQTVDEQTMIRKKKQPAGAEQLLMIVKQTDVLLTGEVSETGHLADKTRKALKAMTLAA